MLQSLSLFGLIQRLRHKTLQAKGDDAAADRGQRELFADIREEGGGVDA